MGELDGKREDIQFVAISSPNLSFFIKTTFFANRRFPVFISNRGKTGEINSLSCAVLVSSGH